MTCARIQDLFGAYWDDETTQAERERIEAHLSSCEGCRARYEEFVRAIEMVASLPRLEAAPDLLERVMAGARRAAPAPDRLPAWAPVPRWVPAMAAAAVLLVVAVAVGPRLLQREATVAVAPDTPASDVVREPALVHAVPVGTGVAAPRSGEGTDATAPASTVAALTDSLFDHSEDVEFMVDPVALRRNRDATRAVQGLQTGNATISF